ncbi:hypothetical protein ACXR2U_00515 [Jatrophihabitans sp. YIM 134969]
MFEAIQHLTLAAARCYGGRPRATAGRGARGRILARLQSRLGDWIAGDELAAVSGIGEWARRVRELRLEQGFRIEEQDGMYRLLEADPDTDAARRWHSSSAIRRGGGTARDRVLTLLSDPIGGVFRGSELSYVAGGRDALPLVRELRDGEGLPIDSALDCRDLHGDQFRLLSLDLADRRDSLQGLFPESVRAQVFRRDDYTCWRCHRDRVAADHGEVFYLQVHYLHAPTEDLEQLPIAQLQDLAALATYCRRCLREAQTADRRAKRRGQASSATEG